MARGFGDDNNRDRWRDDDRERSNWRSGGQGTRERDDERGFFERAGQEIKSWFNDDDDRGPSSWDRDRERNRGEQRGWSGSSSWDRDQDRSSGRDWSSGRGQQDRSTFGGMAQGGQGRSGGGGGQSRGYGPSRGGGEWRSMSDRDRSSFGQGASRSDQDWNRGDHPQSWGEANRGQSGRSSSWDRDRDDQSYGYGNSMAGSLGGFGNQTSFGSSQDDHYRSWRDRQMSQLDEDYQDYCREREQQFHGDFESWRRTRQTQSPSASTNSPGSELGTASNAGVGTTTGSITGSAGQGSAPGSATGTGGSIQADTTGSTEAAGTGGSSRSSSRSRS